MPGQSVATVTYPHWAVALYFDEVVIVKIAGIDERRNVAEVQIFTLTANQSFWPYMPQNVFHLSCSELLRYLPRDQQPIADSRSLKQRGHEQPFNLPTAAWDSFMDIRDAHYARLKDRSLAVRKQERCDEREHDNIMMSYE